ncbi:MAG: FAD-dependent oxidoreductase [Thermomicrobiales bacterium]
MSSLPSTADVVIVGAGMAGLTAARTLIRAGLDVVVLEARDRVGGRMHSVSTDTGVIDLGATWFWPNEPFVQAFLHEYGLTAFPQRESGDALLVQSGGHVYRLPQNADTSPSYRVTGGAQALPMAIAAALPSGSVVLDSPVHAIAGASDSVTVHAASGSIRAGQVIVAMPPSLALDQITFTPVLPAPVGDRARRTAVWMGDMVKAVVRYERPFWREHGMSGFIFSEEGPFRELHDHSGPDDQPTALFGFAPAATFAGKEPSTIGDAMVRQLKALYGDVAIQPLGVVATNWRQERYTSPRQAAPDATTASFGDALFRQPLLDGRVFLASTEASEAFAGHVEGAIRTGLDVATLILRERS